MPQDTNMYPIPGATALGGKVPRVRQDPGSSVIDCASARRPCMKVVSFFLMLRFESIRRP